MRCLEVVNVGPDPVGCFSTSLVTSQGAFYSLQQCRLHDAEESERDLWEGGGRHSDTVGGMQAAHRDLEYGRRL